MVRVYKEQSLGAEEACILDIRRTWPICSVRGIAAANFYSISNSTNDAMDETSIATRFAHRRYYSGTS